MKRPSLAIAGVVFLVGCAAMKTGTGPTTWEGKPVLNKIYYVDARTWPSQPDLLKHLTRGKFYIPVQDDQKVAVVDPDHPGYLVKLIDMPFAQPHHPWATPGMRYVYINYQAEGKGDHDAFSVIDTWTDTVVKTIRTGTNDPFHGAFSPVEELYVTGSLDPKQGEVFFIDPRSHEVIATIQTSGTQSRDALLTQDGRTLFVGHQGYDPKKNDLGPIDVIDVASRQIAKTIACDGCGRMKMSPNGRWLLASSPPRGYTLIIDTATREVVKKIEMGSRPGNINFTKDSRKAYVGMGGEGTLAVIDVEQRVLKTKLKAGKATNTAYPHPYAPVAIACNDGTDNWVTIVDTEKDVVIEHIETAGKGTHNATWSADGRYGLATNRLGDTVTIFRWEGGKKVVKVADVKVGFGTNGVQWGPYFAGNGVEHLTVHNVRDIQQRVSVAK
jgi:DNA-binding beta-propeller fold protein YncE